MIAGKAGSSNIAPSDPTLQVINHSILNTLDGSSPHQTALETILLAGHAFGNLHDPQTLHTA